VADTAPDSQGSSTTTGAFSQPQTYADMLRRVVLHMRLTDIESLDDDTLVLRFGRVAVTLHLEECPAAVRIDLPNGAAVPLTSAAH